MAVIHQVSVFLDRAFPIGPPLPPPPSPLPASFCFILLCFALLCPAHIRREIPRAQSNHIMWPTHSLLENTKYSYPLACPFDTPERTSSLLFVRSGADTHKAGEPAPRSRTVRSRSRPSCTHMQVERLHGPYSCDACHRPSPLGWVYLCTQDFRPEATTDIASPVDSFMDSSSPAVNMDELRALEMSKSITTQIQAGGYTPEQIEIIKAQKVHVHKVLAETVLAGESSNVSDMASPNPAEAEEQAKDEEEVEEPSVSEDDDAVDKITRLVSVARLSTSPICTFKTCHSCRPYFRDRLFTSIEAVLNGEERSIDEFEMRSLHTMRADITRGIGLKGTWSAR